MKKTFIKRLATLVLFAMIGVNLFSQGFYVYTKDGLRQNYASENVDSIVFYEKIADNTEPGESGNFINGHEYVDLGLSVKWATRNVGASSPEDSGDHFAWAETEKKESYTWNTYFDNPFDRNHNWIGFKKYIQNLSMTQYDVAHIKWGGGWRMPTFGEFQELLHCDNEWTTFNGKEGLLITGPNGNKLFLPTGSTDGNDDLSDYGYFWTSTPGGVNKDAKFFYIYKNDGYGKIYYGEDLRYRGFCVRPVTE